MSYQGVNVQGIQKCSFGLDFNDCVLVLIDHQSGMLNLVRDMDVADLRNNVLSLAKAARLARIPVILTALNEDGPHGKLLQEFDDTIPDAHFVHRLAEVNPWDCQKFVSVLDNLNRKTLIMAGTLANVNLAATAISAACCGFKVFAVLDASGASSKIAREITLSRFIATNVIPIDSLSVISLFMKTFERKDIHDWCTVLGDVMPRYKLLIDSFCSSQTQSQAGLSQGGKFAWKKPQQDLPLQGQGRNVTDTDIPTSRYGDRSFGQQDVYKQDYHKQDIDTGRGKWP